MEVDVVAYELYGLTPDEFTAARNARARELTRAGNRPLATEVRALAKPSTAAWLVNILVRRRPETLELLDLGPQLRQAVGGAARDEVRRLSDRRQELIRVLAGAASVFATEAGHALGPQVQRQLEGTLEAGVADEAAAAAIRGGALAGPLSFVGFATVAPGKAGTTKPGHRGRGRATEAASQESVAVAEDRRGSDLRALRSAEQQERRRAELESAATVVAEASRRFDEASARQRRAEQNVRDAERATVRAGEALRAARKNRARAERNVREAGTSARPPRTRSPGSPP